MIITVAGATLATVVNVLRLIRLHRAGVTYRAGPWRQEHASTC